MTEPKWVVIDLDGTLCDCDHRIELAQAKQWDDFHAGIPDDKAFPDVSLILRGMTGYVNFLCITGRTERYRKPTVDWLDKNNLMWCIDQILMRPDNDRTRDSEMKLRLIDEFFGSREKALEEVAFILEDRDQVVEGYRGAGFHCWQCRTGGY